jgi:hypothetical protein
VRQAVDLQFLCSKQILDELITTNVGLDLLSLPAPGRQDRLA